MIVYLNDSIVLKLLNKFERIVIVKACIAKIIFDVRDEAQKWNTIFIGPPLTTFDATKQFLPRDVTEPAATSPAPIRVRLCSNFDDFGKHLLTLYRLSIPRGFFNELVNRVHPEILT